MPDALLPETAKRVLERLGLGEPPPPTLEGLNRLYRAWCRSVPFDNVRKRIALVTDAPGPLPGAHAEDFLEAWLRHGTGGTCWPSSNGLFAMVRECGFDARRVSASMGDRGEPNHGSVLVRIDGQDYMTDSSMLVDRVFPLPRNGTVRMDDPVHPIVVEPAGTTWLVTWAMPFTDAALPCRILEDPVDHPFYLERYEISRGDSPFNDNLYARRNFEGSVLSYLGAKRFRKGREGVTMDELDEARLVDSLVRDLGLSEEIVARLGSCGGLGSGAG